MGLPIGWVGVAFAVYGVGQGLTQPALINIVIGGSGIGPEDTGSAVGLFLTAAQSCIAFGVRRSGCVFWPAGRRGRSWRTTWQRFRRRYGAICFCWW